MQLHRILLALFALVFVRWVDYAGREREALERTARG